ncbi:unnamed protein product, partial [Effrenium voratum]
HSGLLAVVQMAMLAKRHRFRTILLCAAVLLHKACITNVFVLRWLDGRRGVDPGLLVSKALSIAVIGGSFLGKMPQVSAVWRARSAEGLSKLSIWTETVSMGVQLAYNLVRHTPITTYAEIA